VFAPDVEATPKGGGGMVDVDVVWSAAGTKLGGGGGDAPGTPGGGVKPGGGKPGGGVAPGGRKGGGKGGLAPGGNGGGAPGGKPGGNEKPGGGGLHKTDESVRQNT
jgi:hypothetical protein